MMTPAGGDEEKAKTTGRYALGDGQWERIKDEFPKRAGHVGVTARDTRLVVEALLWRYLVPVTMTSTRPVT